MATKEMKQKLSSQAVLKKLFAGVSLLAFVIIIVVGLQSGVRLTVIVYRSALAMIVIGIVARVILRVLTTYEEMNCGKG
jgi:hypothetical protein